MTIAKENTPRRRFLIGGCGALAPILLSLVVFDGRVLATLDLAVTLGYVIRVAALFAIGGLAVVFLDRDEVDAVKLFKLGIAAPALLTTAINGRSVSLPDAPPPRAPMTTALESGFGLVGSAHAAEPRRQAMPVQQFRLEGEPVWSRVMRGAIGGVPEDTYFVISSFHPGLPEARERALALRRQGFDAEVFAPYGDDRRYKVVIGANLSRPQALALRSRARDAVGGDPYIWTFPDR